MTNEDFANRVELVRTRLYKAALTYLGSESLAIDAVDEAVYHLYGAKGITVCDDWRGREGARRFCEWALSHGYDDTMTIDRIETDRGYCPDNCMWVSQSINSSKLTPKQRKYYKTIGVKNFEFYDDVQNKAIV